MHQTIYSIVGLKFGLIFNFATGDFYAMPFERSESQDFIEKSLL